MKVCKSCNTKKSLDNFHKWKYGEDGHRQYCKVCRKVQAAIYYQNNKDMINTRKNKYRSENIKQAQVRRENNRDKINADQRAWYKRNTEKKLQQNREWYASNPEKRRALQRKKARKRRAQQHDMKENFNHEDIIFMTFGNKCFCCSTNSDLTLDHHLPLSKGNVLAPNNCVLLCRSCNSKKGTTDPVKFYTRGQLHELDGKFAYIVEMTNG